MSVFDSRSSGTGLLVRLGFEDPTSTAAALEALGLWRDGRPVDEAAGAVVTAVADVADPDLALSTLVRLLDAVTDADCLRRALRDEPALRRRLLGVVGTSVALGDHLVAHPADWHALEGELGADPEAVRPTLYARQAALLGAVGADPSEPTWGTGGARAGLTGPPAVEALRAAYRRCVLELAARDATGSVTVEEVGAEMADLASATLSAGLAVALASLPEDAAPCRLAVIGMGKAGGRELNYVSDVDVVFVAEAVDGASDDAALRSATRLASEMMRVCGEVAWPVDAGLRPEGGAGPLVRTLASHEAYYRRWASTWEFQALLKARPLAGDLALGRAYADVVEPLVWRASERTGFVEDVQAMRRRVEGTLTGDRAAREVKLGPGGLRDVEFAVQLLQLVHGRADDSVRSGTTLVALEQLAAAATSVARTLATSPRPTAGCGRWSTGCSCTACAAPTCCPQPTTRPACAGSRGPSATAGTCCRRSAGSAPATATRCAGCTRSCSTGRCSVRWPACPPTRRASRRRPPVPGSRRSASPSRPWRCATSRR